MNYVLLLLCLALMAVISHAAPNRNYQLHSVFGYDQHTKILAHQFIDRRIRTESSNQTFDIMGYMEYMSENWVSEARDDNPRNQSFVWESNCPIPNIHNADVLYMFGAMTNNAYYTPNDEHWTIITGWTTPETTSSFGWTGTGLRGYVFYDQAYREVVVSFKGSEYMANTEQNDFYEDWLMFSCCAEEAPPQIGTAYQPSECSFVEYDKLWCEAECFQNFTRKRFDSYYIAALGVFNHVKSIYTDCSYFFTDHSLGGAIAALVGHSQRYPAVTFESPPVRLHASVLGFNTSDYRALHSPIFNFGAYDDPIYMGANDCEPCISYGVPIKTQCHLGYKCIWYHTRTWDYGGLETKFRHSMTRILDLINTYPIRHCYPEYQCHDCHEYRYY